MSYSIAYLADYPQHVALISKWYWDEWDQYEGWDIQRSREFAKMGMNKDKLDMVLIALNEKTRLRWHNSNPKRVGNWKRDTRFS